MSLDAGTRLGSYEIVAPIGSGAMGDVYRGRDLKLGRKVAIKVLIKEFAADPDRLRRFEQEARAASALNHPNIVHIYDIGREDDVHYLVMELIEGSNLRQLLADGPFDIDRLLDMSRQIAAGLANAHAAGIVHRDIKPENIMVTEDGFVKILDFGLAKLLDVPFEMHSGMATMARLGTRVGMLIGTVEYMSPEQAAGKTVDRRSDQFSLGLILYEMATGAMAFHRETAAQTLASIIENEPRAIAEQNAGCPAGFMLVVRRCLRKNPDERYADTRDIVRELEELSAHPGPVPPLPPVPQNPEPDVPPLGRSIAELVGTELDDALGEASREIARAIHPVVYQLRVGGGRTRSVSEERLRKGLRRNRYSGTELIRRDDESEWVPLYDSAIFKQEVPIQGDPRDWSRARKVKDFLRHALAFAGVGAGWLIAIGEVPMWMAFWGLGLGIHALSTAPAALSLLRSWRKNKEVGAGSAIDVDAKQTPALADGLLSQSFRDEAGRVKELLRSRAGASPSLVDEIDAIVERVRTLAAKRRDLVEQTSQAEQKRLEEAVADAERKLNAATTAGDRQLFERRLEVLRDRERAIVKAVAVVERLAARQDVAEHQIKQLRLDLSRGDAASAPVPELTSRLHDIRHEVDAEEKVDEAIATELLS